MTRLLYCGAARGVSGSGRGGHSERMRMYPTLVEDRVEAQSVDEQQILSRIQEIQSQLEQLRASDASEALDDDLVSPGMSMLRGSSTASSYRLIMVSNRLPVSITKDEKGKWTFKVSSGGLVTALNGLKEDFPFIWVGWVGIYVPREEQPELRTKLLELGLCPVFLEEELVKKYYDGFCNDVLWPLFHYTPLPSFQPGRTMRFDLGLWNAYRTANGIFRDAIAKIYQPGDLVWIHDYHLMRVPALLRKRFPQAKIGWFLHTPFPSSDMYLILPVRSALLEGILMADLIGFHCHDYVRHFLSCCQRCLGLETAPKSVFFQGHTCSVSVYPIGIEPQVFENTLQKPQVQERLRDLKAKFKGKKVVLGVDRLDYVKGIPHKLAAIETLFEKYPQWQDKFVLVQIAVPSRTSVIQYQQLMAEVNQMVGRINGKYGTLDASPIHYLFQSVPREELCALYAAADACIVSSVRDGMNLVSHEYVACQKKECGVLILSEFAGAAQSLSGALRVNPWNAEELADSIHRALEMSFTERLIKETKLYRYVKTNTASAWGVSFVHDLVAWGDRNVSEQSPAKLLPSIGSIRAPFMRSKSRLIVLDYEGTLITPRTPSYDRPTEHILSILRALTQEKRNHVLLMTTYGQMWMDRYFSNLDCTIFSEDSGTLRSFDSKTWEEVNTTPAGSVDWKQQILPILDEYVSTTPGSYMEILETSVRFIWRDVELDFGRWQIARLEAHLAETVEHDELPVEVLSGNRVLKIRPLGSRTKGDVIDLVVQRYGDSKAYDFGLCLGQDAYDEDMFDALKSNFEGIHSVTCRVGHSFAPADYYVPSTDHALQLLEKLYI